MNPVILQVTDFMPFNVDMVRYGIEAAQTRKQDVLPIIINSPGGRVSRLFEMVDILEASKLKLITIVTGVAYSAGAYLFSIGSERYASQRATLMIHDLSAGAYGTNADLKSFSQFMDKQNKKMYDLIDTATGKASGYWQGKIKANSGADLFLTAEEALTENLVTKIGIPNIGELFNESIVSKINQSKFNFNANAKSDLEKYELIAQFISENNKPVKPAKAGKKPVKNNINVKERKNKIMDLTELIASLTGEQVAPIMALQQQIAELEGKLTAAGSEKAEAVTAAITKYEADLKASNDKFNKFVIDSLVENKKLAKADADRKLDFLSKLPNELKEDYIKELMTAAAIVPGQIPDMGEAAQDLSDNKPEASRMELINAIAKREGLDLTKPAGIMKANEIYIKENTKK